MSDSPEKDDPGELFIKLYTKHESRLRNFVRSMVPTWESVDEVMQEASLVMWRKFDQFDPETEFLKWSQVVCRFEALKCRRRKARDRHVFSEDLLELLATEIEEEDEEIFVREKQALRECLKKVKEPHRELLLASYAKGAKIKEVAEAAGKSPTSVYKLLNRVRESLHECITNQMKAAEDAGRRARGLESR